MGQSVHATGFRLGTLKNWKKKECIPEKELYVKKVHRTRLINKYLIYYFDYVLPGYFHRQKKYARKQNRKYTRLNEKYKKKAYRELYKKWKEGKIAHFDEEVNEGK